MTDTRNRGIKYLTQNLGQNKPKHIAVSKLFDEEESWKGNTVWWFDLPIEKINNNPNNDYYLLGESDEEKFIVLKVPNQFFIDNLDCFDTQYKNCIRLHLGTQGENRLVDKRGMGRIDFSKFEQ